MSENPIVLDEHRGMAAQRNTEIRRQLAAIQADQAALRGRREELEKFLLASPATTWPEAAAKARYLITLFGQTSLGRDPRRQRIIADVLGDFERLAAAGDGAHPPARDEPAREVAPETEEERKARLEAVEKDRAATRRARGWRAATGSLKGSAAELGGYGCSDAGEEPCPGQTRPNPS